MTKFVADKPGDFFLGVGALATIGLLFYTGRLWRSTSDLVERADINAQKELRAYLGVLGSYIFYDGNGIQAGVEIVNNSSTPAYRTRWWFTYEIADSVESARFTAVPQLDAEWDQVPGAKNTLRIRAEVSGADAKAIREGTKVFLMYGRLDYFDAFDKPRHIEIAYRTQTPDRLEIEQWRFWKSPEPVPIPGHYKST
jgi:hypothetical protein